MATKKNNRKYEPSRKLLGFHVAGFQHWDGALVLEELKAGTQLELALEQDNPHDPNAIAIYYNDIKLGYVPASENDMLSTFFFFGHEDAFEARVLQTDPEANPWDQVRVGVYVKDAR